MKKDSTGDLTNTGEYIRLTRGKDFSVMLGRDTLIHAGPCMMPTGTMSVEEKAELKKVLIEMGLLK